MLAETFKAFLRVLLPQVLKELQDDGKIEIVKDYHQHSIGYDPYANRALSGKHNFSLPPPPEKFKIVVKK